MSSLYSLMSALWGNYPPCYQHSISSVYAEVAFECDEGGKLKYCVGNVFGAGRLSFRPKRFKENDCV
jgi:hypothetical protein